ncbi:MAG: hypothetical protein CMQ17_13290 [Gammaproteobacteria bacterium]|nr:hypothetical protein [Gammaproteobacteria bacterium]HJO12897.1 glycosyltransferase family 39 protein [Gammaproteobacteria bacterium]
MQDRNLQFAPATVIKLLAVLFLVVFIVKLYLAAVLDLYSDEIFYWQESTHPALAYSDLPFMTAMLTGLGAPLAPGQALAARSLFLALGSSLPFLVYWIARPVTSHLQALESAVLTLCLPLGAFVGLLAVPDVPLLFFGLLSIGLFERALRRGDLKFWLGTGIVVACGLSTHYRFVLYPLATLIYLFFFHKKPGHWRTPGLWVAMGIALLGLVPVINFNLSNQLASASFYLLERHPWEFQVQGLLHLFKQAGLVTPPLYAVFALTLWHLLGRARRGDQIAALFLCFSLINILVYMLLAPWTDSSSTSIHWPLSGYFPLLVFVPASLRQLYQLLLVRYTQKTAIRLLLAIPALGFAGTVVAFTGVGSQGFQQQLQAVLGTGVLSNKMAGWKEFSAYTEDLIQKVFAVKQPIIITDNYYSSAQVEFANLTELSYTLDNDKAVNDGRLTQYQIWQRDETALQNSNGESALFLTEDSELTIPAKQEVLQRMCTNTDQLEFLEQLNLFNGDKRFSFYKANRITSRAGAGTSPCPYPSQGWIDRPVDGDRVSGVMLISGWAFNEDIGVEQIFLVLNGTRFQQVSYGRPRPDVVEAMGVDSDPNKPGLGFSYSLDTQTLKNGSNSIALEIINNVGEVQLYGEREVIVSN